MRAIEKQLIRCGPALLVKCLQKEKWSSLPQTYKVLFALGGEDKERKMEGYPGG